MEAGDGTAVDTVEGAKGVKANDGTAVDIVKCVDGVKADDDTAVDTVERVEGVEYTPVALSGYTEATFPVDPLPIPPEQNLEGFGMRPCCIVPRHWFDG